MAYGVAELDLGRQREALVDLWRVNVPALGGAITAADRLTWFFERHPNGAPKTVVAADSDSGLPIGCASLVRWDKWIDGVRHDAAMAVGFAVSPKHRTAGAALMVQRGLTAKSREAGLAFVVGLPSEQAKPIFDRVGYKTLGVPDEWVRPLKTEYKVAEYVKNAPLRKLASFAVDNLLAADDLRRLAARSLAYKTEIVDHADGDFEALWEAGRGNWPIAGDKSAAFVNWRYLVPGAQPVEYHVFRLNARTGRRLAAFLVYTIDAEKNRANIVDLFAAHPTDDAIDQLLLRFAGRMRRDGREALSITFLGSSEFERRLERLRFFRRRATRPFYVWCADETMRRRLLDKDRWFLVEGELDI